MISIADHLTVRGVWEQQVAARPGSEFLVFEDPDTGRVERYTYEQFDRACNQVANLFAARGIGRADRVAVQLCNSVEFVQCLIGLAKIGGVLVPLNASYTRDECLHVLGSCEVSLLVTEPEALTSTQLGDRVTEVIVVDQTPGGFAAQRDAQPPVLRAEVPLSSDDLVEVMFTSGSTSRPKGVMLTNYNFVFSGLYTNWELTMSEQDRYLSSMAASHVNLQLSALLPVITAGATLILVRRYSASRFWAQVRRHRATLVQGMAMIVRTLMLQRVDPQERDHCVREVHYFLPITDEEKIAFEDRFAATLFNTYGSTETLVGVITDLPNWPRKWPSIGRVGLGYDVRIVDPDGADVAPGEVGEILVRGVPGRSLMLGYWRDEKATAEAIDADGWFRTGDCGRSDDQGWCYFVDRRADLIKRAGENISTAEVEDVLLHCPGVAEVAVFGIPDGIRDEAVVAIVVPDPSAHPSAEDVRRFAAEHLAYFKVPSVVQFRNAMPRGAYGKIQKCLLRRSLQH